MNRHLEKVLSWIMLAVMIYNITGYVFFFELAETYNRESIERFLFSANDKELQIIKVSDLSSVIRSGDDEIIYQGKHYDVKKEIIENGYTCFYCIHDNDEENIYTGLSAFVNSDSQSQADKHDVGSVNLIKNAVKDFFFQHFIKTTPLTIIVQRIINSDESFSSSFFFSVITPPPKA